ncbi:MAG: SDR family NAD(P)-dependent oxidoreductase [Rhodospirillaceae bacterium]|nr:SDR family NAD(P)-dependent oxidoreductase [Rhodospirillaceae bacterium]
MGASFVKGVDFTKRAAVITGAGGGMGLQISRDLLRLGADVLMLDVKARPEGIDDGPGKAIYVPADITDEAAVASAINGFFARTGRLDYLGNIAGLNMWDLDGSVVDGHREAWDRTIDVNVTAMRHTLRHAIPLMIRSGGGSAVQVSSIQCVRGDPMPQDAYQVSKAGVLALSRSIAIQFAEKGIRSNAILPGVVVTPMQARLDNNAEMRHRVEDLVPLRRIGDAQDIANLCLFLFSDLSSYITGTEIVADGGMLALPAYAALAKA